LSAARLAGAVHAMPARLGTKALADGDLRAGGTDRTAKRAGRAVPARPAVQHPRARLRLIVPIVDVLHKVSLRIVTMPIQSQ